jgi:D-glycero-D-manno-heptose 1,7-bisphosphate phosphatase
MGMSMTDPVVFLDKDGTLIENIPYNVDISIVRLVPFANLALRSLNKAGWRIAVVTNQSGVARGFFKESALAEVETRLQELLAEWNVPLAGFFYCPHHPEGIVAEHAISCRCRKPEPGLILAACERLDVSPRSCWLIGDSSSDIQAGHRAGCRTILICPTSDSVLDRSSVRTHEAPDLFGAAEIILWESRKKHG